MHTRVRDASLGLDSLDTFTQERQAFMGALHVACPFVLPGEAVFPTESAADDMAWETFRILAMNDRVVSFHAVFALGPDLTAVVFAGVDQVLVLVTTFLAEMTLIMYKRRIYSRMENKTRDVYFPSTAFNTTG